MELRSDIIGTEPALEEALKECRSCTRYGPGNVTYILDKDRLMNCRDKLRKFSNHLKAQKALKTYKELLEYADTTMQADFFGMLVRVKLGAPPPEASPLKTNEIAASTRTQTENVLSEHNKRPASKVQPAKPLKSSSRLTRKPSPQKAEISSESGSLFDMIMAIEKISMDNNAAAREKLYVLCTAIEEGDPESVMERFQSNRSEIEKITTEYHLSPRLIRTLENAIRIRNGE